MPFDQVPAKFSAGTLRSGGSGGPVVKNRKQMIAIMLSEKRKSASNPDYAAANTSPLANALKKRKKKSAMNPGMGMDM